MTSASPDRLVWTPELVEKFWDYQSQFPQDYFTYQFGAQIVDALRPHLTGRQEILDFGCGAGFLLRHLLLLSASVTATDTSPESLAVVRDAFCTHPSFRGGFLPGELEQRGTSFDAVTCVEVVEHLYDDQLRGVLKAVHGLLAPGGVAVFTTPHREDLRASEVYCPVSNLVFHRWQHVRSWDGPSLARWLAEAGFGRVTTFATDFAAAAQPGPTRLIRRAARTVRRTAPPDPHLVAVAHRD